MMNGKYIIRNLLHAEVGAVVELVNQSFSVQYLIPSIYRAKGIAQFIQAELENKCSNYRYFVVTDNEAIMGYAEFKINTVTRIAYLNIICVSNDYKKQKAGNTLFNQAKSIFEAEGFEYIQLDVFKSNLIAYNWYRSLGFCEAESKYLYNVAVSGADKSAEDIAILNYPQFRALGKCFGFSMLDAMINGKNYKIGWIENDWIIRQPMDDPDKSAILKLADLCSFNKIYMITDQQSNGAYEQIYKMSLKLNQNP